SILLFCFFFSSRRRHTRFSRDWSSDVCSSDLPGSPQTRPVFVLTTTNIPHTTRMGGLLLTRQILAVCPALIAIDAHLLPGARARSEERRVGKECRRRW